MGYIFISYAHEDKSIALEIYKALQERGLSPWLDDMNLLPGQDWKAEIEKVIHESDIFLACLSNSSVNKKGFVQAELRRALEVAELMPEGKVYIIPVLFDECKVPIKLSGLHWVNFLEIGGKEKLYRAIQYYLNISKSVISATEQLFNAGRRLKAIRDELFLKTSEFIELVGINSQREYEAMERLEKEVPLSLLKTVSDVSGANIEWLKHEKGLRYNIELIYLKRVDDDLDYCASLHPKEYFLTFDKKSFHVGLVAQTGIYCYQVIDTGLNLDFWNWVDEQWAIPKVYEFLKRLSDPWKDIDGVILPPQYDRKLFEGDIHFLVARSNAIVPACDLLYDLLDLDHERLNILTYSKIYEGNWMGRVQDYFRDYLGRKTSDTSIKQSADPVTSSSATNLEEDFEKALYGTYEAARKRGYVATYFLQMLEEHGGVETAKRLLAKSEPQAGLFELWNLNLLHESMEAVVNDNPRFHILFTQTEILEAHRRLEELGYFEKSK